MYTSGQSTNTKIYNVFLRFNYLNTEKLQFSRSKNDRNQDSSVTHKWQNRKQTLKLRKDNITLVTLSVAFHGLLADSASSEYPMKFSKLSV